MRKEISEDKIIFLDQNFIYNIVCNVSHIICFWMALKSPSLVFAAQQHVYYVYMHYDLCSVSQTVF